MDSHNMKPNYVCTYVHTYFNVQWNLFTKDTHIGTSQLVHCRGFVDSSEVVNIRISTIGKSLFGALESVLCREVITTF